METLHNGLKVLEMKGNEKLSIILFEKSWYGNYKTYYCKIRNNTTQELFSDYYEYSTKEKGFYRFVEICDINGINPF